MNRAARVALAAAIVLLICACGSSGGSSGKAENGPLALSVDHSQAGKTGIYRRDPSGALRQVTSPEEGLRDLYPTWSHDGKRIAFLRESRELEKGSARLFVVNGDGSDAHQVGDVVALSTQIGWAPDDDAFVYVGTNNRIWTVKSDGTVQAQVYGEEASDPAWSPDGERIVFARGGHGLTSIDADGGNVREITHPKQPPHALLPNSQVHPAWSGRRIAFVQKVWIPSSKTLLSPTTIEIVNADGTGQRTLTKVYDEFGVQLAWSPDGRSIAFTDIRDSETGVWVVPSSGGQPRGLLLGGVYYTPSWGPAGP